MLRRQFVLDSIRSVFESWGFDPLETPAFEDYALLSEKGGSEIKDEIYYFKDKSDRELGLRFDLTIPLARVIASNPQLPKPFKRYCISRVWRYDRPGTGRYREFWQADVDIVGSPLMQADAECICVAIEALQKLGFQDFTVRLNNRKIIEDFVTSLGIKNPSLVFRAIDKLEKLGQVAVEKELADKLDKKSIEKILKFIKSGSAPESTGLSELREIERTLDKWGYSKYVKIDLSLVRGLDYYTGPVFEIVTKGMGLSIAGGGRYNRLIEQFGGKPTAAVGISLGIERLIETMEESNMFSLKKTNTKIFVVTVSESVKDYAIEIAKKLRSFCAVETDIMDRDLKKQLEYANAKGIPYVAVVGPAELKGKKIKIKSMKTGEENEFSISQIEDIVKSIQAPW